jgi:hypothetical protein
MNRSFVISIDVMDGILRRTSFSVYQFWNLLSSR